MILESNFVSIGERLDGINPKSGEGREYDVSR
jgi:hypothetical protein